MDSKSDIIKEETPSTEEGVSKVRTGKIKTILGGLAAAVAVTAAAAAAIVNTPQHDDVVILTPTADSSQAETVQSGGTARATTVRTTKVHTTSSAKKTTTKKTTTLTATSTTAETTTSEEYDFPADINRADKEMLMAVNGIGEVTADRIIAYRDSVGVIWNMDMLLEVNGIGSSTLELLKGYFYVDGSDYRDMPQETEGTDTIVTAAEPVQTTKVTTTRTTTRRTTTTRAVTTTTTTQTTTTAQRTRQKVNINTASAEEIADKLLIDIDKANAVVELRELISYFESPNELLLCEGFTEKLVSELWDYIEI